MSIKFNRNQILIIIPFYGKLYNNLPWEGIFLNQQSCPEWLSPIFDQLYNEHAAKVTKQPEIHSLNQVQQKLEEKLKDELTYSQFQQVLEWEEIKNRRLTLEIEAMYLVGLKSVMRMILELQNFIVD